MKKIKLICFPYAGGSAQVFLEWKKNLHSHIELVPIELSGRGKRFSEPLISSFGKLIEDIYPKIIDEIGNEPYCFFGHSMGSYIIFELLRELKRENRCMPICCFFSGKNPPHFQKSEYLHTLEDEKLLTEIVNLGGTPVEILDNKELADIFLPILRSDLKAVELYKAPNNIEMMNCAFIIFYSKGDPFTSEELIREWSIYTTKSCEFYEYNGGHFYIHEHKDKVIDQINSMLINIMV